MMRICCFCTSFHLIREQEFSMDEDNNVTSIYEDGISTRIYCDKNYWYMDYTTETEDFRHHIKKGLFCKDFRPHTT